MPVPGYNPDNTEDYGSNYGAIPDGSYPAMITEYQYKETKSGGQMLVLTVEVIDGPCKGRKVWENLNVVNKNETAQNIAHSKLKGYFNAVSAEGSVEEQDLVRIPFGIKTKTKQNGEFENTDIYILDSIPEVGTKRDSGVGAIDDDDIPF